MHQALSEAVERKLWAKAAAYHNADGLQRSPDLEGIRKDLAKLAKEGKYEKAAVLLAVATGTPWTGQRLAQEGLQVSPLCQSCKSGVVETNLHRCWECVANREVPDAVQTQRREAQAKAESAFNPALWLRGIPQKTQLPPLPSEEVHFGWGPDPHAEHSAGGITGGVGDGSGTAGLKDQRFCRAGRREYL